MGSVLCMIYRQQPKQPIQQAKLSPLYRLSCYIFRTTTGTTCTTKKVVLVVLVVVLYFKDDNWNNLYNKVCCPRCFGCRVISLGRQLEQLIQQSMLSPLFWLSCILRTTTGTTCTTSKVVPVVLVVVLYFKDKNWNGLYRKNNLRCGASWRVCNSPFQTSSF